MFAILCTGIFGLSNLKLFRLLWVLDFLRKLEFDFMYLDDPAAMTNLLLNMADRNIVSDEFVQRHIKAKPDIEKRRVIDEEKVRVSKDLEKISPYHAVDKQYGLEKIALQTGVASPSQVGVELKKKKGDKAALDMKQSKSPSPRNNDNGSPPGSPGRPQNSRDIQKRKPKQFKPKNKASIDLWAKEAQSKISTILNPGILERFAKKNMRSLTAQEFNESEQIKFSVLCSLSYLEVVDAKAIGAGLAQKLPNGVIQECEEWITNATHDMDRKLSIDEIRNIRATFYVEHCE